MVQIMLNLESNKDFQFLAPISETVKIKPYYSDESQSIWEHYDRNWLVYSKKNLEVSF